MKKTCKHLQKFKKLFTGLFCLAFSLGVNAQFIEEFDYHDPDENFEVPLTKGISSEHGRVHTPQGPLKVLMIYAQFEGDQVYNGTWGLSELPDYNDLFYTDLSQFDENNTDLSLSNFYYQMSKHSANPFKMYGAPFPHVVEIGVEPGTSNFNFDHFTSAIYDTLESKYSDFDWSIYDERDNWPDFSASNVNSTPDKIFDYVVISFRWNGSKQDPWGTSDADTLLYTQLIEDYGSPDVGGWASIQSGAIQTTDSIYNFSGGFTNPKGLMEVDDLREFFLHEFGHTLYWAPHYNGANSVTGEYFYTNKGWGMMGSGARNKYCALGWEQWWLGWNEIEYDLSSNVDDGTYTLNDFLSTGDMMRLQIPNTDQYLWLEFHEGTSVFEKRSRLIEDAEDYHFPENANGVLAYIECISDNKANPYIFKSGANGIKYLHGNGNYDYSHSPEPIDRDEWWPLIFDFFPGEPNPFSSHNGLTYIRSDFYNSDNIIDYDDYKNNYTQESPGDIKNEMAYVMLNNGSMSYEAYGHSMNLKVNRFYSIGSNPALIEHQIYNESTQELSPIRLHGLKVSIIEVGSDYAKVNVNYDYNKVTLDTRWAGNIELPSNQTINIEANVTIDRTGTPSRENPDPEMGFYPYSNFKVKAGGNLNIVRSNLNINDHSTIYFESGSNLDLGNINYHYGYLNVDETSKIVFEGGVYEIDYAGQLLVEGTLEIEGNTTLKLNDGALLNLASANIVAAPGASLTIEGNEKALPMVYVNGRTDFESNLDAITFKNGKIVMNTSDARLYMPTGINSLLIDNVHVTSGTGSYLPCLGFTSYNLNNITLKNSTFENLKYGFYTYRPVTSELTTVQNCAFKNCYYGMYAYNSGVDISNSSFSNNQVYGLKCNSMDKVSHFNNSTFNYNGSQGLYYVGSGTAHANMDYCTAGSNGGGVYLTGPFDFDIGCSSISNNNNNGVEVSNNVDLQVFATRLSNNNTAIKGSGSSSSYRNNWFSIYNGFNDLRSDNICIEGGFYGFSSQYVDCKNNFWKTGGGSPDMYTDYYINDGWLALNDNSPEYYFQPCYTPGPIAPAPLYSGINGASYQTVKTSLGTMDLKTATETIFEVNADNTFKRSDEEQYELLTELLLNNFNAPSPAEQWYIDYAYKKLMGKMGEKKNNHPNKKDKVLKVLRKLRKESLKNHAKENKKQLSPEVFAYLVDEANFLHFTGKTGEAIALLNNNAPQLANDDACYFRELICQIEIETVMTQPGFDGDVDELLAQCKCNTDQKSGTTDESDMENAPLDKLADIALSITPNPTNGNTQVIYCVPDEYLLSELKIVDAAGRVVFAQTIEENSSSINIRGSRLNEGVYLVGIYKNNQVVSSEKMVVVK